MSKKKSIISEFIVDNPEDTFQFSISITKLIIKFSFNYYQYKLDPHEPLYIILDV